MDLGRFGGFCAGLALTLALGGCGGGGGGAGDIFTSAGAGPTPPAVAGPASFLLFPNPQVQADGIAQTVTAAYAGAYYQAIDPTGARDTLEHWKTANGLDGLTPVDVTFGDVHDLGYGRHLKVWFIDQDHIYAVVENYQVSAANGYGYSSFNLDAAVVRDTRWLLGINAIEYSPGPAGGASFAKFYTFTPTTHARKLLADLDGNGDKAMPGICISCHGGRGDALMPAEGANPAKFNLVQYAPSGTRGDTQARMQPLRVDTFGYSSLAGFSRAEQEAQLKQINTWLICTYPRAGAAAGTSDACRKPAAAGEWQGTTADFLQAAYGGPDLPNAVYNDTYLPTGWASAGQGSLYQNVVAPYCRTCHIARGTGAQSDLDFDSYAKFQGYADRIYSLVLNHGNMPLAELVFNRFWTSSNGPESLAQFLEAQTSPTEDGLAGAAYVAHDGGGGVLKPGRPIADPGPDRVIPVNVGTVLSASGSLYATTYQWSVLSGAGASTLTGAGTATPTFTPSVVGAYQLRLVASQGALHSPPATLNVQVAAGMVPLPTLIRFADIKAVFSDNSLGQACVSCHFSGNNQVPVFWSGEDHDPGLVTKDDLWLFTEVRSRINFTNLAASALLRKPSGHHHNGLQRPGFNIAALPGDPSRQYYDLFLNWILNGAPE